MLQRLRESLALLLIALLPFHAFIVTVKTRFLLGPGNPPMGEIAVWKEVMLAIILGIALIEIIFKIQNAEFRMRFDRIDVLIMGLFVLGILISLVNSQFSILHSPFFYGIRYDFVPLLSFVLLRRVPWSDLFFQRVRKVLITVGSIVAAYGILSFFLPQSFFTLLGYNDLHSLYLPDSPIAPYQQIGGTAIRRIQSVMSGPNQLGLWLLVPLAIATGYELRVTSTKSLITRSSQLFVLVTALVLTFSRAAWIGAAVIIGLSFWPVLQSMTRKKVTGLISLLVCLIVIAVLMFPSIFLRFASSRGHIENPIRAIETMINHPLGLGLGTAGPASNRTSDACVMLDEGSDASWATAHPNLCVFVGESQVQPSDRDCQCPFLPENWYLQIGVEMGWIGLVMYLALVIMVLKRLWELKIENEKLKKNAEAFIKLSIINYQLSIFAGIGVAALFLHAWEDSAVAYTVWIAIAAVLPVKKDRH